MKSFGNLYEFTSMAIVESELDLTLQCLESIKKSHIDQPIAFSCSTVCLSMRDLLVDRRR